MGSYNLTRYGEELLERTKKDPPSFTIHLHSDHFNLNASKKLLYTHPTACIFDDIRAHRIPVDFLDLFDKANVPFYDGCMIVELLDYRSQNKNEPVLERPEQRRMVLHPNGETLWADICLLSAKHDKKYTDKDIVEIEARVLLATAPPLCLDPDPHLSRIANHVLRVSTPTEPALLKRKADVVEPEERETEKAKRAKIMQFGNPRLNRPYAPSYRILDALDRKSKGTMVTVPPLAPKPQPTGPPSRAPSQTPVPQAATGPLTPSSHSSPANTPTPYNLPHSPAPPAATVPTSQPQPPGPTDDPTKRLQAKPPTQFTIPIHSTPTTSATPVGVTTNGNAVRGGARTPVLITTGPTPPYQQHLMSTQPPRRSVSPTKPQMRPSPSPVPGVNSQHPAPIQATAQAHLYPSVQAATAAAAGQASSPPSNATNSPATELSPAQATELAKRAATPVSVGGPTLSAAQQQRYSQSPRVMPAVMQRGSPQAQVHPGRSATPAPSQQPLSGHQQSPPSQHQTGPVSQLIPHPQQLGPQHQTVPQYALQRNNITAQSTPTPAASQLHPQQQPGATTSAVTGGTPTFMVNPNPAQGQPNPTQNGPIQTLQPGQPLTPQQHQMLQLRIQQNHATRMKMMQAHRAGTPVNQGMVRANSAQMLQLQQIQQMHQQQQQQMPQQQQQMQQHASPRPTPSQPVISSPIVSAAQGQTQGQRTVTPAPGTIPNPGVMVPGGVGRGSPMLVHNQRMAAASPMPANAQPMNPANVNPNPAMNSPRMTPQQAITVPGSNNFNTANFHYQAQLARMRQQGTPAPGVGVTVDGQNPGTPQRPQQPQQNQPPVGMPQQQQPQQSTQNPNQNQTQNPGMQQQHGYPMFYATAGQSMMPGRIPQGYWPGMVSQHGGVNPAMQNTGQNGQVTPQQQMQFYPYMVPGRGRGFAMPSLQHQQQGRGGGPGNMPGR